jgi:putative phage-type endonuclease
MTLTRTDEARLVLPASAPAERWHAERLDGLGGSEIAAVLGLSPWESRFSLWHRKAGLVGPQSDSDRMAWGRFQEQSIASWYAAQHPEWTVRRTGMWRNNGRPSQFANPDRLASRGQQLKVVEIKTAGSADGWGGPGTDEVPVYYRCQVLWYLDALGLDEAVIVVSISGAPPREYLVRFDIDEALFLREEAAAFLATVELGERPDIDAHSATYQVLRELHPLIDDIDISVDPAIGEAYVTALEAFAIAEDAKAFASAALLDEMGTARRAIHGGRQIAMRIPGRNGSAPYLKATPAKSSAGQKVGSAV